ncbi:MAG TPA: hypothetical protein VEX13_07210 [Chloroflexia bacterium]|nr:hypothetical protein [Chloroflexia bacterium]
MGIFNKKPDQSVVDALTESIIDLFDTMGGDPSDAIRAAKGHSSVRDWRTWQAIQVTSTGALAALVPGAHVPALIADAAFLMNRMAHCSWGIGGALGARVDGKYDLAQIMGHWAGATTRQAIGSGLQALALGTGLGGLISLDDIAFGFTGNAGTGMLSVIGVHPDVAIIGGVLLKKGAAKLAVKLAGKMGAGFIPLVGAGICATINNVIINGIADSAVTYYEEKRKHFPE